jgi:hypothetical protein
MKFLLLSLFILSHSAYGISAKRKAYENFEDAFNRVSLENNFFSARKSSQDNPYDQAIHWNKFNVSNNLIEWKDLRQVNKAFVEMRNKRFIETEVDNNLFLRRSSWLLPEDGCWLRAELAKFNLEDWNYPETYKLYIFGNLKVETENSVYGEVYWWYHVANAVYVNQSLYILDPAIHPDGPLLLNDWIKTMNDDNAHISLCEADSYDPYSKCSDTIEVEKQSSISYQKLYLDFEWRNLISLGRDPYTELGDNPPWK